ncbi:DUF6136 family protein [Legionella rowbothamii]|uniref:DUF6136 family protein n=1 Tax=Legionella rowbothamii TaxID=96229 RepID=UPI00105637CF|nr:hypothetical protein [Legionella rowbothamii]
MFKQNHLDKSGFNQYFLKLRIQYYFNETTELLARHKLLLAFIICLLAPGVAHIQAIGIPFYALVDTSKPLTEKLIYLVCLVIFLLTMTISQSRFIKGGAFREYLHTLHIPSSTYKKIDFIILLLSLNIVWFAVFCGALNIVHYAKAAWFVSSQYCLYAATILVLITLLWNCLYRKMMNGILLFSALLLVLWSSKQGSWIVNYSVSCFVLLLSGLIIWTVEPLVSTKNYLFKTVPIYASNRRICQGIFVIQLAVLRESKRALVTRLTFCLTVSILILQLFSFQGALDNREGIILFLVGLQTYILSTLFAFFEKGKLDYALFHQVFPYQRHINWLKEITIIFALLTVILFPVFLFCIFSFKNHFLLLLVILVMGFIGLIINRIFYAQSLRFCLFTSSLGTMGSGIVQHIVLGACFGA